MFEHHDTSLATRRFHLIGVGGAGMSVVAELLADRGAQVSGSDREASRVTEHLADLGVKVSIGHDAAHVPSDATVVVSTAIRPSNPELAIARTRGQEVIHRSEALALAATGLSFVAVAGAHGKTTTSGMLAVALGQAGRDPSVAVGGVLPEYGSGAHLGSGDVFVAEADESDGSFVNYQPSVAIVTNVEPDHLDRYGTRDAFEAVFVDFARRIVPGGQLIVCAEDAGAVRLAQSARDLGIRVVSYGRGPQSLEEPSVLVSDVELSREGSRFTLSLACADPDVSGIPPTDVELSVPGEHNVLNAAAVWAAGVALGVSPEQMARGLSAFTGTVRRFEFRGEVAGRRLFDDYAHHPTEVAAAIRQARLVAGSGTVTVVFQPHLYSRTRIFADDFARSLALADTVIVTDIYAAREDPEPGLDSSVISRKIPGAVFIPDMHEAARVAASTVPRDGILVTMGAGSVTTCGEDVLRAWSQELEEA
ncbi:UDP-N-acetylmuramate--L-alanine ligase [Schaalia sp. ZJ405]|uniref:UDP-N-acetylmuramate--L-alanine ligase n=1 Tax=Schaalia sp. ZJ405 TaxID=2709403 RepID=UPI0013EAAACA|nr:UDP-N-acetylmuramate--L-alanine ligase [Schaalia sp. ZJ405]QPK81870.1 UDP-N-acetylmuramate--L-alanine ligase [Schaalia sp. ZJ405]